MESNAFLRRKILMDNCAIMNNDDWMPDGAFLESIFSMEADDLLSTSNNFVNQSGDMLMQDVLEFADAPMFNDDNNFNNGPMFSSAASDSGLSSDNLDLDVNNEMDFMNSAMPSPAGSSDCDSIPNVPVKVEKNGRDTMVPTKRSVRNASRNNNNKTGSATMRNGINNNNKKSDSKILQLKNSSKSRSIIVPVAASQIRDFRSIKIVNSGSSQLKSANIKAVAANLLQKSKQGLLQKNILIPKQEIQMQDDDDDDLLNFDDIMQETEDVLAAHDDDDDDVSSAESCSSGYPKLILTNEEKRLLSKEGISLPASYPLTKHEERELKRIRRKIRNKISAQDSRKRKKEYIDGLEERVKQCSEENQHLIKRIKVLQSQNHDLMSKMKKLQTLLTKTSGKTAQPATCLMILLLSMALVAVPNLKLNKDTINPSDLSAAFGEQQNRRNLLFDLKSELEDLEPDDPLFYSIPNEHDYVENVYKYVSQLSEMTPTSSPPPAKRQKTLIDYEIDSIDEWEQQKRSERGDSVGPDENLYQQPKITVSKDLFDIGAKNRTQTTLDTLSTSDRMLAQSIINLAASALQKSSTS